MNRQEQLQNHIDSLKESLWHLEQQMNRADKYTLEYLIRQAVQVRSYISDAEYNLEQMRAS